MNVRIELRRLAGLSGDQEHSRRLREDIMFFEGTVTAVIEDVFAEVKERSVALPMSERGGKLLWRRR